MVLNLVGDGGASTARGAWSNRDFNPILRLNNPGTPLQSGAILDSFFGAQAVPPRQTANETNPISDAFRAVWTPTSYQNRSVRFVAAPGTTATPGRYVTLVVQYGTAYTDPSDPSTGYALYLSKEISPDFGNGFTIPVVPAPGASPILAFLALPLRRGRRRHGRKRVQGV
jgi:hypothetical protein